MRKIPDVLITVTALAVAAVAAAAAAPDRAPLRVVPQLDYQRYSGTWYEIARLPFRYQKDCASDVTATYAPRPDGRITVTNRCVQANGTVQEATGVARRVDGQPPSVLKVRFAPAVLSFLPMVWGDYQVIALGPDYDYALVGTPDRSLMWILSRTPQMDSAVYTTLTAQAQAQGFNVAALIRTRHTLLR